MYANLFGTKRGPTSQGSVPPWLGRLGRAIRPFERLRSSQLGPLANEGDDIEGDLFLASLAEEATQVDSFAPTGGARLAVDCTLSGDRCNDPSRYFVEMGLAQSPVRRLRSALRDFILRRPFFGRSRD